MGKLLLLCGAAIVLMLLIARLRRLLAMCAALCVAAAAVAIFLLPLDGGFTLWERAQREGVPHEVATAAAGAWRWVMERVPGEPPERNSRWRRGTEPLARAQERRERWDDRDWQGLEDAPEVDRIAKAPPRERLVSRDRAALDGRIAKSTR